MAETLEERVKALEVKIGEMEAKREELITILGATAGHLEHARDVAAKEAGGQLANVRKLHNRGKHK